jgi:hypothetical protein
VSRLDVIVVGGSVGGWFVCAGGWWLGGKSHGAEIAFIVSAAAFFVALVCTLVGGLLS